MITYHRLNAVLLLDVHYCNTAEVGLSNNLPQFMDEYRMPAGEIRGPPNTNIEALQLGARQSLYKPLSNMRASSEISPTWTGVPDLK